MRKGLLATGPSPATKASGVEHAHAATNRPRRAAGTISRMSRPVTGCHRSHSEYSCRPVDLAHPAHADLGGDLIRAEASAGAEGQFA